MSKKLKNWYELLFRFFVIIANRLHTYTMFSRFGEWGHNSWIAGPCTLVSPGLVNVGSNVYFGSHVWLNATDNRGDCKPTLYIGNGSRVGRFVQINAWRDVTIGCNVLIADRVFISDADHVFSDTSVPIINQGDAFIGPVCLHDGCWIGIGAVILPGVSVGKNSVVAANAVVTRDVPDFCIVGGVPAKVIRYL